ncbi:MAG: dTMP kinase [Candidatus Heimdallarchaeota archaeon]|nr:dTMP kinase [Candidatus Heimdallarchaeota archaeon]
MLAYEQGRLIAFEGIDGTGKTTLALAIKRRLEQQTFSVVLLKEPTNETTAGKKLRESYYKGRVPPEQELAWFMEDREWNVKERVLPALKHNKIVLLDRYFYSTACYQGVRMNNDWKTILKVNRARFPEPSLTIILDLEVSLALQRIDNERKKTSFEAIQDLQAVRKLFLEIVQKDSLGNFLLLDASSPLPILEEKAFNEILGLLVKKKEKKN